MPRNYATQHSVAHQAAAPPAAELNSSGSIQSVSESGPASLPASDSEEHPVSDHGIADGPSVRISAPGSMRDSDVQGVPTAADDGTTVFDESKTPTANKLRKKLKFFFLNPYEKYVLTGEIPWKLIIQIVKILVITFQLIEFGTMRMDHVEYTEETEVLLRHIMLGNWTDSRDVNIWPPPQGPYAVYTRSDLFDSLAKVYTTYYELNLTAFRAFEYDYHNETRPDFVPEIRNDTDVDYSYPPLLACMKRYKEAIVFPVNNSYVYDLRIETVCQQMSLSPTDREHLAIDSHFIDAIFRSYDMPLDPVQTNHVTISFRMKTIRGRGLVPGHKPSCFNVRVKVDFDNSKHSGVVDVDLNTDVAYAPACEGTLLHAAVNPTPNWFIVTIDVVVLIVCVLSFVLCSRALIRAYILQKKTESFFAVVLDNKLSTTDKLEFLNLWYVMIVINDIMIMFGTSFKLSIEHRMFDSDLFTEASLLLGSGTLLVWCGLLRYLGFFSRYNILILTIKKSFPNVMRFLVVTALIYIGFMLWGWIVLGPYSAKCRTVYLTFCTMFALINGDDMFATFYTLNDKTPELVLLLSRFYLVTFISLFIYVVLSLFISIIMDAYEIVKDRYGDDPTTSPLHVFINSQPIDLVRQEFMNRTLSVYEVVPTPWRRITDWFTGRSHTPSYAEINERTPLVDT